ncbi:MAG: mycothiol synthase [Aeromicrobium sp.]
MTLLALASRAREVDGVDPLNEASRLALDAGHAGRVHMAVKDGSTVVAAAFADGLAPVELVVDPEHRRQGHGGSILTRLLAAGESEFWAHGDLPAAQALAASKHLEPRRTLLVLRLEMDAAPEPESVPEGVTIRTFEADDVDAIVQVNGRAFASHPEQGAMDRADFEQRASSDWYDPAGLFVAERDGNIVGFHWTKIEDDLGEVYVVGVDPTEQGSGLGTSLTARGLRHLHDSDIRTVDLYVEGDNDPALAVYRRLGFTEHARDVLYVVS